MTTGTLRKVKETICVPDRGFSSMGKSPGGWTAKGFVMSPTPFVTIHIFCATRDFGLGKDPKSIPNRRPDPRPYRELTNVLTRDDFSA
jgi:hypothetical protein